MVELNTNIIMLQLYDTCYIVEVDEYVIKAQILAGGRGKGTFSNGFKGGVHLTKEYVRII